MREALVEDRIPTHEPANGRAREASLRTIDRTYMDSALQPDHRHIPITNLHEKVANDDDKTRRKVEGCEDNQAQQLHGQ